MVMANPKKEKNGTYSIQVFLGKNPETNKRKSTTLRGFKTQKEARLAAGKLEADVANGDYWKKEQQLTYQKLFDKWWTSYAIDVAESTQLKTKRLFHNHFLPKFGEMLVEDITPKLLQEYVNHLSHHFIRAATMFNYLALPLEYAEKLEYIKRNPANLVKKPRRSRAKKHDNFYEEDELKLFLQTALNRYTLNPKACTFFFLLAMTGMRKQEITALTWQDIDYDNKTLTINKAVKRREKQQDKKSTLFIDNTKNPSSDRIISIDNRTIDYLKKWKDIQQPEHDGYLIFGADRQNFDGNKIISQDTPRKWLVELQDVIDAENNIRMNRITIHGFRHTHATLLFQAGKQPKQVQDRLGHSDIRTSLDIYAHVTKKAREDLAETLPSLIDIIEEDSPAWLPSFFDEYFNL
jgi:integrase